MVKKVASSSVDNPYAAHNWVFEEGAQDARRQVQFASPPLKRPTASSAPAKGVPAPSAAVERGRRWFQWHTLLGLPILAVLLLAMFTDMQPSSLILYLRGEAFLHFQPEFPIHLHPVDDSIPSNVVNYIDTSINRALLGHIGRRDYALALDGARISPMLTSPGIGGETSHIVLKSSCYAHAAEVVLRDNLHGGRCWLIPGSQGQIGIFMRNVINPTHVTIDHVLLEVARRTALDIGQAPRSIRVWGVMEGRRNEERYTDPPPFS